MKNYSRETLPALHSRIREISLSMNGMVYRTHRTRCLLESLRIALEDVPPDHPLRNHVDDTMQSLLAISDAITDFNTRSTHMMSTLSSSLPGKTPEPRPSSPPHLRLISG